MSSRLQKRNTFDNTNQFVQLCASGPVVLEINESYVKTQDDGGFNLGVKHVQGKLSYQECV